MFYMCAVIGSNWGYDCDEKWSVYVYSDPYVTKYCYPYDEEGLHNLLKGCASYNSNRGHMMMLSDFGTGMSHTGHSVLEHEIKHLSCLCNFHANPPEPPRR